MATLDDIVEANMLNAEYLQEIHSLQKEQYSTEIDTNQRFRDFFVSMQRQRAREEEARRERGAAPSVASAEDGGGAALKPEGSFASSFGSLAGKGLGAGVGLAALGFGIGGFFAGLAAGDKALTWMDTDLTRLTTVMKTLTDGFAEMNNDGLMKVGALLAAGGAMGALFGPGRSMKAGFGMFALGAGIGGFFAGLAAGDAAANYLKADGTAIKNMMINLAEGLGAFAGHDLAVLGGLLATGGLFGALPGGSAIVTGAAVGMTAIGAGIGGFFAGLAAGDAAAGFLNSDGSNIRDIMVNLATGLGAFSSDEIDIDKLLKFGPAAASVAAGMAALSAGELISSIGNFVTNIFSDDGRPSVFERIADDLKSLSEINIDNLKGFDALSQSLFQLGDGIDKIANADMDDFRDNIEELGKSVAFAIPIFDKMWNGGKLGEGFFDGYDEVDFGKGLKASPISQISGAMNKVAEIPIGSAVERETMSAVGESGATNVTVVNNTNAPSNVSNQTVMGGDAPLPSPTQSNGTRADAYAGA